MTIRRPVLFAASLLCIASLFACGGGNGKIGETCDAEGEEPECESGAICGKNTSDTLQCLKVCDEQSDCPEEQECNGVDGSSLKGCRPKSDDDGSGGKTK